MLTPEPKKILFLTPSLTGGGAERVLSILLRHLDRNSFEPHLGVLHGDGAYVVELPADVVVHDLKIKRARYALPAIVKLVWRVRPQTVMSSLRNMNMLLIMSKWFLPRDTKLLVRESAIVSHTLRNETDSPRLWSWLYRRLYKRADRVVTISDAMSSDLVDSFKLPPEKLVRIYNPVDSRRVRELAEVRENPYHGVGPYLAAAGRFSREKGFDILLNALPAVIRHFPTATIVILGEGPLKAELTKQARQLGLADNVQFPGFDPNPWRYLRHADLFVLSSRYDGLPNVVLEALALGTPVVATDCPGGIREIQACAPEMALVPPEDPDALAQAIIAACGRSRVGSGCHKRVLPNLSRFDLRQIVAEYSRLF